MILLLERLKDTVNYGILVNGANNDVVDVVRKDITELWTYNKKSMVQQK